ncbi:hypothetical protein D1BOALGB6SA_6430 [Olavius sp. associated proteobacterium Delta 1]|nr:hypothetical protein D1BOALGB6SA_6430 [Olavius sp. associated proteobacterium Delta 1]
MEDGKQLDCRGVFCNTDRPSCEGRNPERLKSTDPDASLFRHDGKRYYY